MLSTVLILLLRSTNISKMLLSLCVVLCLPVVIAIAQRTHPAIEIAGTPTAYQSQNSQIQLALDPKGGVFALWRSQRAQDRFANLYLQRLDDRGESRWTSAGVQVAPAAHDQGLARMVGDGAGGVWLLWAEKHPRESLILAQRVNAEGKPLWMKPLEVYRSPFLFEELEITTDFAGGVLAFWTETQQPKTHETLQAQRLNAEGRKLWGEQGKILTVVKGSLASLNVVSEAQGGVLLCWNLFHEATRQWTIQLQRMDEKGEELWKPQGVYLSDSVGINLQNPSLDRDGAGGAFVAFERLGGASRGRDIWCARVSRTGAVAYRTTVNDGPNDQQSPRVVQKQGQLWVAWEQRNGSETDLYAQRVDRLTGLTGLGSGGKPVCTAPGTQSRAVWAVSAFHEAQLLLWLDERNNSGDLFAQQLNDDGQPLWPRNGLPMVVTKNAQADAVAIADEQGGAWLAWLETVAGFAYPHIQRVNKQGQLPLGASGKPLLPQQSAGRPQLANPQLVLSPLGDAYLTWEDFRNGNRNPDIYLQRLSPQGKPLWQAGGIPVCTAPGLQSVPVLLPYKGGTYVGWMDRRNGTDENLYLQKVDSGGNLLWEVQGKLLCGAPRSQSTLRLYPQADYQFLAVWTDARAFDSLGFDLYLQLVDPLGNFHYARDGVPVVSGPGDQTGMVGHCDESGCAFGWMQETPTGYSILLQRLDRWLYATLPPPGLSLNPTGINQRTPALVHTPEGDSYLAWNDDRLDGSPGRVRVQRVNAAGRAVWYPGGNSPGPGGGNQYRPSLAWHPRTGLVVGWLSQGGQGNNTLMVQAMDELGYTRWRSIGLQLATGLPDYAPFQLLPTASGVGVVWAGPAVPGNKPQVLLAWIESAEGYVSETHVLSPAGREAYNPQAIRAADGGILAAWLEKDPEGGCRLLVRHWP